MREREIANRPNVEVYRSRDCGIVFLLFYRTENRADFMRSIESDGERERREKESMRRSIVMLSDSRV